MNAWLEQEGYLVWAEDSVNDPVDTPQVGFSEMTRHIFQLDWAQTVAYAATPSSLGINIARKAADGGPPMPAEEYERITWEIAAGLLGIRHPASGRPIVTEVHMRQDVFAGPYDELGPDLTLVLEDGAAVSILRSEAIVRTRQEPNGNHHPEGVFIACGPMIKKGVSLGELSIVDVAPTLLYSLDVALPDDMSGALPTAAFEPCELQRRPPRYVAGGTQQVAQPLDGELDYDDEDQAMVMSRLRALGYVE